MRAGLTNLTIESPTQRYHPKQPLYMMLTQARGDGEHFWEAYDNLVTGGYREGRTPAEGPLPKPEQVLVACWKWAWKGLDPEICSQAPKGWRPEEKRTKQDSTTRGANCDDTQASSTSTPDPESTPSPGTTPPPGTATPVEAPMQESTLKLIDPGFEPKEGPYPQWLRNVTRDCGSYKPGKKGTEETHQQDEVRRRVVPCLVNTSNYWVKYQYIATVYSKDRDIWPGMWSKPMPVVSPRPWAMSCDSANSTCTVSLARRHCQHVPGWKIHCLEHYKGEYDTHGSQVVWKKIKNEWVRAYPPGVGCAKVILGHGMSKRKEVLGKTVPFVVDPTIIIAEGHAFRKSLCEGKETTGYEWLGPNRIYNNGTCHSPEEHWMHCGSGKEKHECTLIKRA
ncbi:hypothetical protein D5F01_LYC09036 [Larimichthys crocea]|uniref:Uncharacterized protein n=1 Tax=Larimichthys crocea TaxID=215358 RepID=A0A6G0IJJ6_LARCR|nr:hypothetical protein D5F01_LYC09036 [Larimichthys crocea]